MRFYLIFFSFTFLLLCLQTTILNSFPGVPVKPDITIVMVSYLGIFKGPFMGLCYSFALGYVMDTLSGSVLGLYSFLRVVTLFLTRLSSEKTYLKNGLSQCMIIILLSIIDGLLIILIMHIFSPDDVLWPFVLKNIIFHSFSTGIIGPFIFYVINKSTKQI